MKFSLTQSIALVRAHHGVTPGKPGHKAYHSPAGVTCIGWGCSVNVQSAPVPLSADRASAILVAQLTKASEMLETLVDARIDQHHWNALTCWLWSVQHGHAEHVSERWDNASLLSLVDQEKLVLAAGEFEKWSLHRGRLNRWMHRLRDAERTLFCTGELPC